MSQRDLVNTKAGKGNRNTPAQTPRRKPRKQPRAGGGKVDELGVIRGQNAEKGNDLDGPIRREDRVSH